MSRRTHGAARRFHPAHAAGAGRWSGRLLDWAHTLVLAPRPEAPMTGIDWFVVALYFALVLAAALLPGLRA
ncbi:MAG TPA: hypothetical protein VG500_17810, partial [Gemmatimonadales bacterium]|nr:hypothetical protein [Gemmatimonadales bacterium]